MSEKMKNSTSNRAQYATRPFRLISQAVRDRVIAAIQNAPMDEARPLEVVIREEPKKRKQDQNSLMFAGPLRDITEQAWVEGRQFTLECWHSYCKGQFLPEAYDPELTMEGYVKYDIDPAGDRVLVGSTTQLTVKGFAEYLEQIYAFGAALGVQFTTKE